MVVKRRRKKKGGFLLGTIVGVAPGVAGGTALLRRAAATDDEIEVRVEGERVAETARAVAGTAQQAPAAARRRAQGGLDQLRERWQHAVSEGRRAARDRERELKAQYAAETKRVPEFQAELLGAIEERTGVNLYVEPPATPPESP